MLLTSYFQHLILHHFSLVKLIWGSCISFMPVLQRPIPLGVQTGHIFRQDISINVKFGLYAEGSCTYRIVLFVNFYLIRYGDTAVQSNCTFLVHFAPLTHCNLVPATPVRAHEYTITSRAHATTCTTEVPPFFQKCVGFRYHHHTKHGTYYQYRYARTTICVPVDSVILFGCH